MQNSSCHHKQKKILQSEANVSRKGGTIFFKEFYTVKVLLFFLSLQSLQIL